MRILPATGVSFAMLNVLGYSRASGNPGSSADLRGGRSDRHLPVGFSHAIGDSQTRIPII